MKKRALFLALLFASAISATALPADSLHRQTFFQKIGSNFSFAGCAIPVYYAIPLHEKLPSFPLAYNSYVSPLQASAGAVPVSENNSSFRFFGIYYHDKLGLELYWNAFGGDVDMSAFSAYVQTRFAGYNTSSYRYNNHKFSGPQLAVAYLVHVQKFVIAPKLSLGFEKQEIFDYSATYRENGSNQFVEHSIRQSVPENYFQHSYHAELDLGRRFAFKKSRFRLEAGLRFEYIDAPYRLDASITEKPYGQAASYASFSYSSHLRLFSAGAYLTFVIMKAQQGS